MDRNKKKSNEVIFLITGISRKKGKNFFNYIKVQIYQFLRNYENSHEIYLENFLLPFGFASLYHTPLSTSNPFYPNMETVSVFKKNMVVELVNRFSRKTFGMRNTKNLTVVSKSVKTKYYYQEKVILQHVSVQEKVEKQEMNALVYGLKADILQSPDIQQIVGNGGT